MPNGKLMKGAKHGSKKRTVRKYKSKKKGGY